VFRAETFDPRGRAVLRPEPGGRFWISDLERTVVDAFRLRHFLGEDVAHAAVRRCLRDRPKPARLAGFGRALRLWRPMSTVMRVLEE
jgi:hypothetical protein